MMVETLQQLLPGFLIPHLNWLMQLGQDTFGAAWPNIVTAVWTVVKVMLIVAPLLMAVLCATPSDPKVDLTRATIVERGNAAYPACS